MKKTLAALLLVLVMIMTACPVLAENTELEPVTLTMGRILPVTWNDYPDNAIALRLKEKFNVTIEVIDMSERMEAMMASGDLPDSFIIESNQVAPLIESKFILPLDDLIAEYGQDIYPNAEVIEYQKKAMFDGEHIYGLTGFGANGTDGSLWTQSWGLNVDWERYAAIGCPEVTADIDSIYKVLVDMVNVKPQTDDGLPVYAIAYPTIEMRGQSLYHSYPLGAYSMNDFAVIDCWDGSLHMLYTDPDSADWKFNKLYWRLQQDGLLDPDSFLQDFDTDSLKAVNGQYVATLYHDITGNATRMKASEGIAGGFQFIPMEGACVCASNDGLYAGRNLRVFAASCEHPDRLMMVMNWLYTDEGARTVQSGLEGMTWDYVDGVPTLKPETIEAYNTMNDFYYTSGLAFGWNAGRSGKNADGYNANLFNEVNYLSSNATALEKAVVEHYGMTMKEKIDQMIAAGKLTTEDAVDKRVVVGLGTLPDDLKRILNEVNAAMNEGMVACVMASTEEEYESMKAALIEQIKSMGMEKVEEWFTTNYDALYASYNG